MKKHITIPEYLIDHDINYMADDDLFVGHPSKDAKEYDFTSLDKLFTINVVRSNKGIASMPAKKWAVKTRDNGQMQVHLVFPLIECGAVSTNVCDIN